MSETSDSEREEPGDEKMHLPSRVISDAVQYAADKWENNLKDNVGDVSTYLRLRRMAGNLSCETGLTHLHI